MKVRCSRLPMQNTQTEFWKSRPYQ